MDDPLLTIRDLEVTYRARRRAVTVIRNVNLEIGTGETLGLVGESGTGKTTIGRAILGLAPVSGGSISFNGTDITHLDRRSRRQFATRIQVIFQDPYSSLNPAMTIESILTEPLRVAGIPQGRERVRDLLTKVGLPSDAGSRFPREFSGGQRQRIAIARAMALNPKIVICDEPTSALDVTTQARVLTMLKEIQSEIDVSYLFISHDLGVVRDMSDRIAVLRRGEVVEIGDAEQVSARPRHPYSRQLQLATPVPDPDRQAERRRLRLAHVRESSTVHPA